MSAHALSFAVIIPTRNEAEDIWRTLECAVTQTYPAREIIVVDDSDDATPDFVIKASKIWPVIRLLKGQRMGRTGARNQGILASQADVVIILNADVHLPPDFIARLMLHYQQNADYVLVGWAVENSNSARARFIESQSLLEYRTDESIEWTEGFSCRRELAIQAGLFPITAVPLVAGEDGIFGQRLRQIGNKVVDRSIHVRFVAPVRRGVFWRTYKERTYPHAHYYLYGRSLHQIAVRNVLKQLLRMFQVILLVPEAVYTWRLSRYSPYGWRDWPPYVANDLFQKIAFSVGEWEGWFKLRRDLERR